RSAAAGVARGRRTLRRERRVPHLRLGRPDVRRTTRPAPRGGRPPRRALPLYRLPPRLIAVPDCGSGGSRDCISRLPPLPQPPGTGSSASQVPGVPGDVLADEARDEVVAVVVAGLHAQGQRLAGGFAGLAQQFGLQLALQELVGVRSEE